MKLTLTVFASMCLAGAAFAMDSAVAPEDVVFADGAVEVSLTGAPGDPAKGIEIMNKGAGNCIACHQVSALSDLPFHGEIGPSLDGVSERWSEAELRGIVANAKIMFPDSRMPSFYRTDGFVRLGNGFTGKAHEGDVKPLLAAQEIEDVVAFLMTLKYE